MRTLLQIATSLLVAVAAVSPASARDVAVANSTELGAAITAAQAGDTIVLRDGVYRATGFSCNAVGSANAPITIRAENRLAAKIEFDGLEGFKVAGAYWHFDGLEISGVCAADDNCEHAFHVVGAADHFELRNSRLIDFNAQIKVNAAMVAGTMIAPNAGLIETNEFADTRPRNTANPVTKINIDGGDNWILRGNYLHDGAKDGGNQISYLAFLKSGGKRGTMERNLVICAKDHQGQTRIGLSLGGGGTAPQFCAPAYDANVPCSVEHEGGTIRNNIIVNCSDVGVYLNRAKASNVLFNTVIATAGIDFRFDTTSGEAYGNVLTGVVRTRDGATMRASNNKQNVALADFQSLYQDPLVGKLAPLADAVAQLGLTQARQDVVDDYCGKVRAQDMTVIGAIDHSQGGCDTSLPPKTDPVSPPPGARDGELTTQPAGCCNAGAMQSAPLATMLLGLLATMTTRTRFRRRNRS